MEKGHARGGVYTWMTHCGQARHTRDAWSTPRTMPAASASTISRGFHNDPLCGSAVAAPGVQGHCHLSRVRDSVDGLLDVHAAARGLIQDPALRHPIA